MRFDLVIVSPLFLAVLRMAHQPEMQHYVQNSENRHDQIKGTYKSRSSKNATKGIYSCVSSDLCSSQHQTRVLHAHRESPSKTMLHNESATESLPRLGVNVFIDPCVCSFAERTKYKDRALVTDKNIRLVHWSSFFAGLPAASSRDG
jgi:hypothetical protein